jgi:hypothetical protein
METADLLSALCLTAPALGTATHPDLDADNCTATVAAGPVQEDCLSSLPAALLCLIYDKLCDQDASWAGLRSALALECTCKQLRDVLRENTRIGEVTVGRQAADDAWGGAAWPLIAAHGKRVDSLIFSDVLSISPITLGSLCDRPGVAQASTVSVKSKSVRSLAPLAGLLNLQHLSVDRLLPYGNGNKLDWSSDEEDTLSLQPLASLPALRSLRVAHNAPCIDARELVDVQCLASVTGLTSVELESVNPDTLRLLASLSGCCNLQRLSLAYVYDLTTLQPISPFSQLTYLYLAWPGEVLAGDAALQPLSTLHCLKQLHFVSRPCTGPQYDGSPLGTLASLETLVIRGPKVKNLQSFCLLTALQKLEISGIAQTESVHIGALRGLRMLLLTPTFWIPATSHTSLAFLLPLTNLEHLEYLDRSRSAFRQPGLVLEELYNPVFQLAASLTRLRICWGYGDIRRGSTRNVAPFSKLTRLRALHIEFCGPFSSVKYLRKLTGLTQLHLESHEPYHYPKLRAKRLLGALTALTALKQLHLEGWRAADYLSDSVHALLGCSLPGLHIVTLV